MINQVRVKIILKLISNFKFKFSLLNLLVKTVIIYVQLESSNHKLIDFNQKIIDFK